ncbi:MAG: TonB-dependent receptor [Caulobacteraceae bacterium]|nr:TonB-dependent receptor [Caulobacteraceae bacterium]
MSKLERVPKSALAGGVAAALASLAAGAACADTAVEVGPLEVTATRVPEPADRVPVYMSILNGDDLRARHVADLRGALATVAGAEAPPGGDAGPASAVPSFWGLHEFDAFLLVVDGVPLGGAFNPAIPDLDLTDVERIEVLKGAAPVLYGATAFVGVIQVIHYPAGQAANHIEAGYGTDSSWRADASMALPDFAGFRQSLAIEGKREGFSDPRERLSDGRVLYRAAGDLAGGTLRLDFDFSAVRTVPPSAVPRVGTALTALTPLDANYNPVDAHIDEDRTHGVLAYSHPTPLGQWDTTLSLASSHIADVRGFLRSDLVNADSQNQRRKIDDDYADSHISSELGRGVNLTWGADLLYGRGTQASRNGGYLPALDGSTPLPATTDLHVDEINGVYDQRVFVGEYAQLDWKLDSRWDFNGGLRLNETHEHKRSTHIDGFDPANNSYADRTRNVTRLSGMAGLSYRAWNSGTDEAILYADYRNTFKPAALDFGPDNTPNILQPESAQSYEAGIKGRLADGRLDYEAGFFLLDFTNLVVVTTDAAGDQIFQNAGGERLKGVEAEAHWRLAPNLTLSAAGAWHDARFTHYVAAEGGANIDVSGNQLTLSPHWLGSLGLVYAPPSGLFGSATVTYVGRRWLDLANTAPAGAYATVDAGLGYRWRRYSLAVNATNLGDQRPPVTASEFGDQSFYLLPARKVFVDLTANF